MTTFPVCSADKVKASLGIGPYDTVDDDWLAACVCAVNQLVADVRPDLVAPDARVELGATILAQRWYKRRGADEVAAYTEFGGPPPTIDKDVENLLQINRAYRPVVA